MNKVYGSGEGYPSVGAVAGDKAGPAVSSSDNRGLVEWTTKSSVVFVPVTRPLLMTRRPPRTITCRWLPGCRWRVRSWHRRDRGYPPGVGAKASPPDGLKKTSVLDTADFNPLPYDLNAYRNHRQGQSDIELFHGLSVRSKLCKVELMSHCKMFDK